MLGKLMKHEFRATARIMLPVMGAMVALALLANLSIRGLAGNLSGCHGGDVPCDHGQPLLSEPAEG